MHHAQKEAEAKAQQAEASKEVRSLEGFGSHALPPSATAVLMLWAIRLHFLLSALVGRSREGVYGKPSVVEL